MDWKAAPGKQGARGMGKMMAADGAKGGIVALTVVGVAILGAGVWWWMGQGASAPAPDAVTVVAEPAPAGAEVAATSPVLAPEPPRFDVVRVDALGLATVAGTAPPDAAVSLRLDGIEVAQVRADATGQFAALVTLPPSDAPRLLSLVAVLPDGVEIAGVETVAIGPVAAAVAAVAGAPDLAAEAAPESATEAVPQIAPQIAPELVLSEPTAPPALLLSDAGATVLQAPAMAEEGPPPQVSIDSISYGPAGEVMLSGRAGAGAGLRIYLDDVAQADLAAGADGRWQVSLADVAPGLHALRADQIDAAGKVLARFETPFQREVPVVEVVAPTAPAVSALDPAPVAAPAPITITVQPGLTLWAIARENFGEGVMYVQVFEANRDKIKDPDLIYPGQVFTVPKP